MTKEAELKAYKFERQQIVTRLERICKFAKEFGPDQDISEIEARQLVALNTFKEFNTAQTGIEDRVAVADLDAEVSQREKFEDLYYLTIAKINTLIKNHTKTQAPNAAQSQSPQQSDPTKVELKSKISLPVIKLPEFGGDYTQWLSYRDTFISVIHENNNLSDVERFHYLRSTLKGEAFKAIEAYSVSNSNYKTAWETLQKRYENTRLIVHTRVKHIINAPALSKCNYQSLRTLIDSININLQSLKILKVPTDQWDAILVPVITEKLDYQSNKEWQAKLNESLPTLDQLMTFLEARCRYFESLNHQSNETSLQINNHNKIKSQFKSFHKSVNNVSSTNKISCQLCNKTNHFIYQCTKFLNLTVPERTDQVNKLKLCTNCLRQNHVSENCKSDKSCRHCQLKHNTLLHADQSTSSASHLCSYNSTNYFEVLLSTAIVFIKDSSGHYHQCRVLLDSGSQSNLISKELCKKLKLPIHITNHKLTGINMSVNNISQSVKVTIKSKYNQYTTNLGCFVLSQVTENLPIVSFPVESLQIPSNIALADDNFNTSNKIDLLLGSEIFLELLKTGKICLSPHKIYLQNTHFGWIIGGQIKLNNGSNSSGCHLAINEPTPHLNKQQMGNFWGMEDDEYYNSVGTNKPLTPQETECERIFVETTKRDPAGRFIVNLPFKNNVQLGNSIEMAKKRFFGLENRLRTNNELKENYMHFMREYEQLGHMIEVPEPLNLNSTANYIPHHAVYKDSKIRVVFDASAKTKNGMSLNDNLLTGPVIQDDLLSIIIRFRTFQIILNADIKKMYRQIKINSEQVDYQRILWRESPNDRLKTYQLLTVTYGVTSSPFLATRCLRQLAQDFSTSHPKTSAIIDRDFYVDDLLTGANSEQEALELRDQIIYILNSAGFELARWASNKSSLVPTDQQTSSQIVNLNKNAETKTLGLLWNCEEDSLSYKVQIIEQTSSENLTKRAILSTICKIFDPLGLVNPVIVRTKIFLQHLWRIKLEWDQRVPQEIQSAWLQLLGDLRQLNKVVIPRKTIISNPITIQLHGFADASEKAYGICIYARSIDDEGNVKTQLLIAKSRVAPLKSTTIPRLELLGAVLLAQTINQIQKTSNIKYDEIFLWTDSTIVLAWIAQPSWNWNTYVANRVGTIQSLTDIFMWNHINTNENPADIVSRGTDTNNLIKNQLWWHGPTFLASSSFQHKLSNNIQTFHPDDEIPDRKTTKVSLVSVKIKPSDMLAKYSDFGKLKRCVAWVLRFINNCRDTSVHKEPYLTTEELSAASIKIIKLVQHETFFNEIEQLKSDTLSNSNPLLSLNPFLDENNLLRVGGRIRHSTLPFDIKHQIILPKSHHVTKLIIRQAHVANLHAGAQATLNAVRQSYWPISGRSTVRSVLGKCIQCFRVKPTTISQLMGDLPQQRVQANRPFLISGIDYCGPISIREGRGRGKKSVKSYIALFICFCTKAVHLELVTDLSTEGFLNALRRFISRRGSVKELHSDNGTNFVGSNNELKELKQILHNSIDKSKLITKLADDNIKWYFSPPRTPHFGGIWEANIKSVKYHLKRVIGDTLLTFEEMYTFLTRIEACLNSRPLCPLSNDPNDINALTPGHFLIGEPLTAPLEPNLTEIKVNRLSRLQLLEQMRQHYWKRWMREYITQLQSREKWKTKNPSSEIRPGQLVLLIEDNSPPLHWPLGRVKEVHPGQDDIVRVVIVRVVTVRTSKGEYKRGITKICPLPIDN